MHISAVSIHALAYVLDKYALLPSGASMGDGYGPLVIAPPAADLPAAGDHGAIRAWLKGKTVAIPGRMTSAFLSFRLYLEDTECDFAVVPFDQIFDAVRRGDAASGLLIHEGQLTYATEGFAPIVDLGVWWKDQTGLPLPLGGNVVRKDIDRPLRRELAEILAESIDYGLKHRAAAVTHSMPLARGLDESLADKFIGMYVNDLTRDYGDIGRRAVHEFLRAGSEAGFIPAPVELEFVET